MNPLQETELEMGQLTEEMVPTEVAASDDRMSTETQYSITETEDNHMDFITILWHISSVVIIGVAVCLVFYYIS